MRRLYTFLLYLLTPFILLRLFWKGRRLPAYRKRIAERFTLGTKSVPVDVWVHAVSLGEVVAATPLIDALLAKHWKVLVTTMTPTGSQQVTKRFGERVVHQYIPYDFPWALQRFFNQYTPRLGIIMETELWPNVIYQAKKRNMPLLLVNARLSDKAFKSYEKVRCMFKPLLNKFAGILAQSKEDAKRFKALGAAENLVHVLGNMKFDVQLQASPKKDCLDLKEKWGRERPVVIAASTHNDEENQLLSRFHQLKAAIPHVLLLVVPRHPERFQDVFQLSKSMGLTTGLRSEPVTIDKNMDVIVIDSMGELFSFYQVSDFAFVGGSLVPIGGHNVLEPIAVNVPVFCGSYMNNSKSICQDLLAANAMIMVSNADELVAALIKLYQNQHQCRQQVKNAADALQSNRGTVDRYMKKIETILQ